jgi:hypothetical protein
MKRRLKSSLAVAAGCSLLSSSAGAYLTYDPDDHALTIDQSVKQEEWDRFEKLNVWSIYAKENADKNLFVNSKRFQSLSIVVLEFDGTAFPPLPTLPNIYKQPFQFTQLTSNEPSGFTAEHHLLMLVKNHPNINRLTLKKNGQITDEDLSLIKLFPKLQYLTLCGEVGNPRKLAGFIPAALISLNLQQSGGLKAATKLYQPKLRTFWFGDGELTHDFLSQLDAPNLRKIHLQNVQLQSECFSAFNHFDKLEELVLVKTSFKEDDLKQWSESARAVRFDKFETHIYRR